MTPSAIKGATGAKSIYAGERDGLWIVERFGDAANALIKCPYGCPGDRLWVREAWSPDHAAFYPNFPIVYRADFPAGYPERNEHGETYSPELKAWFPFRWRPSIHIPRRHSRITLEIVNVRVERLWEITEADAQAEGLQRLELTSGIVEGRIGPFGGPLRVHPLTSTYVEAFKALWHKINGAESWNANPWVWVVCFKRV